MTKQDLAANDVYRELARCILPEVHRNLFDIIKNHIQNNDIQTLGVFGTGQEALPFGSRMAELFEINSELNLVFLDYNSQLLFNEDNKKPGLEQFLRNQDYSRGRNFIRGIPQGGERSTYFFVEHNFKKLFPFPNESFDALDSSFSLHHATQNISVIDGILKEVYRMLKPGALFHWGDGNVDMKYSNSKMDEINELVSQVLDKPARVIDGRDIGNNSVYILGSDKPNAVEIDVDQFGFVHIKISKKEAESVGERLKFEGYVTMNYNKGMLSMPLIDKQRKEDYEGMIKGVDNYYARILTSLTQNLPEKFKETGVRNVMKEQEDAERGVVEFYTNPKILKQRLEKAGFVDVFVKENTKGIFCNITSYKPK